MERVITILLDYLAAGDSLDRFLDHFPSVTREQVVAALELPQISLPPVRVLLDESLPHSRTSDWPRRSHRHAVGLDVRQSGCRPPAIGLHDQFQRRTKWVEYW
ncbi:MAG: DUF433 domain-containing protein [Vicinamibacteraceae bacterium]|nr:DUF433 domain-containing protein [Vicinamibacteraceae bacterium]